MIDLRDNNSTYKVPNDSAPQAITGTSSGSKKTILSGDDSTTFTCATGQFVAINVGLPPGFGCSFKGTVTLSGTATLNDARVTGSSNPWCSLIQTGVDTYDIVGGAA